jgi:hypothetical protein
VKDALAVAASGDEIGGMVMKGLILQHLGSGNTFSQRF